MPSDPAIKDLSPLQSRLSLVAATIAAVAFICAVAWARNDDKEDKYLGGLNWTDQVFNWHVVCMIGFICCFSMALLSFRLFPLGKLVNKAAHVFWHSAALFCLIVGLVAVFKSHNTLVASPSGYKPNLYSLHSWIGLAAVLLFGQNYVLGAVHFLLNSVPVERKKAYMPYHQIIGEFAYFAGFAAIETGLMEKNTFISCYYDVTQKDFNPAENYNEIPAGCRLSNGIGTLVLVLFVCVTFVLKNTFASSNSGVRVKSEVEPLMGWS